MTSDNLIHALRAVFDKSVSEAPKRHPLLTDQCPSLPRFAEAMPNQWKPEEGTHIGQCPYCLMVSAKWQSQKQGMPAEEEGILRYFLQLFPQVRGLIIRWFEQPSLRVLPQVGGGEATLDLRKPGPIYATLLGDSGQTVWRSRIFGNVDEATVYGLSKESEEALAAIRFENGNVFVDLSSYPKDLKWRVFYLATEDILGTGANERELFILSRDPGATPTYAEAQDPVGLVIRGRVFDAWDKAVEQGKMDDAHLEVIVFLAFNQMEILLSKARAEVLANVRDQSLRNILNSDLESLPSLLDSFKQELKDRFRPRMVKAK